MVEIGSGFGFGAEASERLAVQKYVGIEPTDSLRAELRNRHPNRTFLNGSLPNLTLEGVVGKGIYDVAIAIQVIEHASSPREAVAWIQDISRMVRPGGRVVIVTPDITSYRSYFWACDYTHATPFGPDSLPQALRDAGLGDVSCRRTRLGTSFLPLRVMLAGIRVITPVTLIDNVTRNLMGRPLGTGLASAMLFSNLLAVGFKPIGDEEKSDRT